MSRVAVLAPHPDDEVLGCTSVLLEDDVIVVHVTEGVPASVTGDEAVALRAARDRESRAACAELGVEVERFVTLDALDQEVWSHTSEIASALAELLPSLECDAVYAPAFQSGHPDHDGLYVAAQLARSALDDSRLRWNCYALYALDERGHPGYGWLHPGLFPDVTDRPFSAGEIEQKSRALRAFTSQVQPGSVVQSWLDTPVSERFAPMPARDAPIPHLRSYYDEVFRFDEQGIDRGTVDRVLRERALDVLMTVDLHALMGIALDEARAASEHDDVPVGAVVVDMDTGALVARRHNERELLADPTAHAEILAMRDAASSRGSWRLDGYLLVVTLEPCPMCAGAAVAARISEVAFGATDPKAGALGTLYNLATDPRLNHEFFVRGGVRADESATLLREFFAERRA